MSDERRFLSPARWAIFEVEPAQTDELDRDVDGAVHLWLKRTAASNLGDWARRKRPRLEEIAAARSLRLGRFRPDLSSRYGHRVTSTSLAELRATIVGRLTAEGYVVVPDPPVEVYAIELEQPTPDGRTRLYVGVTSDLERRLAEHRSEVDDGAPPGRAVRRYGYRRYRSDLVEDFPQVPQAAAAELEAQASAVLRHRGFQVHGDGARRRSTHTRFAAGVSWDDLIAAHDDAVEQ